jgi:hypothetical protein
MRGSSRIPPPRLRLQASYVQKAKANVPRGLGGSALGPRGVRRAGL